MSDPTGRFTERVECYARYRPGYPADAGDLLRDRVGARPGAVVADLGSGTGKLTALLLDLGCSVVAVEPNAAMREAAEAALGRRPGFTSVAGRAEATGLPDASVDLVTAAQAFHWFDPEPTRAEIRRILRPGGRMALLWNDRDPVGDFAREYEVFLGTYSTDYAEVNRTGRTDEASLRRFLGPYGRATFPNPQPPASLDTLVGRYNSASYALKPDDPRYAEALAALEGLYRRHAEPEGIRVRLTTVVIWGTVLP